MRRECGRTECVRRREFGRSRGGQSVEGAEEERRVWTDRVAEEEERESECERSRKEECLCVRSVFWREGEICV